MPTAIQTFEIGGSWSPVPKLLLSVGPSSRTSWNSTPFSNYGENNYPVLCTLWYAPTSKLSLSAGYSYFSNWVNQDVNFGYRGAENHPRRRRYGSASMVRHKSSTSAHKLFLDPEATLDGRDIFGRTGLTSILPRSQTGADSTSLPLY